MKNNCRPSSWWVRLLDKCFGILLTCDHRCEMGNPGAPCQYTKNPVEKLGGCNHDCNQGRNCDCK